MDYKNLYYFRLLHNEYISHPQNSLYDYNLTQTSTGVRGRALPGWDGGRSRKKMGGWGAEPPKKGLSIFQYN